MSWDLIGNITLYLLIGFGALALIISAIKKKWLWLGAIGGCFASVLTAEGISYLTAGHSISTGYGKWLAESPLSAIGWIASFSLAMIFLVLHLVAYYFKRRK